MKTGPTPGQMYELAGSEVFIGRDQSSEIIVPEVEVSRRHARVYLQGGEYWIEDLNSTNGTYVNNQRLIGPHLLRAGEIINLGEKVSFEVEGMYDDEATLVPPTTVPSADRAPEAQAPMPPTEDVSAPEPLPQTDVQPQVQQEAPHAQPEPASETPPPPPPPAYAPPQPEQQYTPPPPAPYREPQQQQEPGYEAPQTPPSYQYDEDYEEESAPLNWNWVFAGCGCMTIFTLILVIAALFWIDAGGEARWCQYLGFLFGSACP